MNHHDRAVAALRGELVDHIPFIGRMELWYSFHHNQGTLPSPYEKAELWDIQRDLDIGIFGFGAWDIKPYTLVTRDIDLVQSDEGETTTTIYHTPYGSLKCRDTMADELKDAAGTGARIEYPFKDEKDYDALRYLIEHTNVVENLEAYGEYIERIGPDGLALPFAGHLPAHQLMIFFMGYQTFYYEMNDNPDLLQTLIDALTEQYREVLKIVLDCPAEAVEVGANYDEQMTPPHIFDKLFAPFYREARQILSSDGKIMVVHGDGEMKILLKKLMDCGIQAVEAITPKPMTSIDIAETRKLWKDKVVMWGGLATVILTDTYSDDEFEYFLEDLFKAIAPGDSFVLGFGDNVPTDASFERVKRCAEYWSQNGNYPISI